MKVGDTVLITRAPYVQNGVQIVPKPFRAKLKGTTVGSGLSRRTRAEFFWVDPIHDKIEGVDD